VEGDDIVADLKAKLLAYQYSWIGEGSDPIGQDVALLPIFPAVGIPIFRFPGERKIYWKDG